METYEWHCINCNAHHFVDVEEHDQGDHTNFLCKCGQMKVLWENES